MGDGGMITMRPDTEFKIDSYNFNGQQDGTEKSFFSLLKGGFRSVTGLIGKLHKREVPRQDSQCRTWHPRHRSRGLSGGGGKRGCEALTAGYL